MFYTKSQPFLEIFSNVCTCNYLHLRLKIYTYLALFFLSIRLQVSFIIACSNCTLQGGGGNSTENSVDLNCLHASAVKAD